MEQEKRFCNFINGEWVAPHSGAYYPNHNPADVSEVLGYFPLSDETDVEAAISAAANAFQAWGKMMPVEREKYFLAFIEQLEKRADEIGAILCAEHGKTMKEATYEPKRAAMECRFLLGESQHIEGITMPSDRKGITSVAARYPLGVVAAIAPWNFPILTSLRKIMPGLIFGNTVVFKPASDTPYCGVLLMEMFKEAGFPDGVVNMIIGRGASVGDALVSNDQVKAVTFTGSTAVGRRISVHAAPNFTRVQLEMGGKNPAIVYDFQDLDYAAGQIVSACFALAGQRCTSISRVIVARGVADELERRMVDKMRKLVVGNGVKPGVNIGPIITADAGEKIMAYIQSARDEGATVMEGGNRLTGGDYDKGFFIEPTLLTNVTPAMKVAVDEIFGPVLSVIRVDSFEEAMQVANDTKYGLASALFSDNLAYIFDFLQNIDSGMAHVNHGTATDSNMPFGGIKNSGAGAFSKGKTNRDFFTNYKVQYVKYVW